MSAAGEGNRIASRSLGILHGVHTPGETVVVVASQVAERGADFVAGPRAHLRYESLQPIRSGQLLSAEVPGRERVQKSAIVPIKLFAFALLGEPAIVLLDPVMPHRELADDGELLEGNLQPLHRIVGY